MQVRDVFSLGRLGGSRGVLGGRSGRRGGWVLSLGKLGAGQQSYYLEAVARGVEDYYGGRGEVAGRGLARARRHSRWRASLTATALRRCWKAGTRIPVSRWAGSGRIMSRGSI